MKYTYKNVTGTTEIEVDEQYYDLLVAMDDEEKNSNRRHGRNNPISLENCEYEGEWFFDRRADISSNFERKDAIDRAMSKLSERQRYLIREHCALGRSFQAIAANEGRDESTIRKATKVAIEKFQKYFDSDYPI